MNTQVKQRLGIKEPVWGKASDVKRLTGWNTYKLLEYRNTKTIKWKKEVRGKKPNGEPAYSFFYDLTSIPELLILKTAA